MNSYRIIFIFICLIGCTSLMAQPINTQTYEQMLEIAEESYQAGDYYNSLEWYDKAYKESKDKRLVQPMAHLCYLLRDHKKAANYFGRILKRDKENLFAEDRFWYGKVLKEQGEYEMAYKNFQQFISETENPEMKAKAEFEMEGIKLLNSVEPNVDVAVKFAGKEINSASFEGSPEEYRDGALYYTSLDRKEIIEIGGDDDEYHAKIFSARKLDEGWEDPAALGDQVNRPGFFNGSPAFSEDGRIMYFTRAQLESSELKNSKIYSTFQKNEDWSPAVEVSGVNGDFLSQHPAPGELFGKNVLFFVSDMDGGYGGKDIYYSTDNGDGTFSTPTNLGTSINTPGDEVTPFYRDGVLYFSSNGHVNIGGFDIYETSWDGTGWSTPMNLGFGYNSSYDDIDYSLNSDGMAGYLVSNRPDEKKRRLKSETCCDDIYMFNIKEVVIDLLAIVNDPDGNPLNGSNMTLKNLTQILSPENKNLPDKNQYQFNLDSDNEYKLVIKKDGYYPDSILFNTAGIIDDFTVKRTVTLKPVPKEPEVKEPEYETVTINQAIRLNNIYYDYDDDKILLDAEKDLNVLLDLMNQYPNMVIELSSHTDSRGLTRYNQDLSQRRAESAMNWLVERNVGANRIKAVGYGESTILNRCVNGVKCSDDEHRVNRRTEFKIIAGPKSIEIKKEVLQGSQGSVTPPRSVEKEIQNKPLPEITFKNSFVDLGPVKKGDLRSVEYVFTNTGNADLNIEIVTSCKCTELKWPLKSVKPGDTDKIRAVFDSSSFDAGEVTKTIDVYANTEPGVTEAKFKAQIVVN